MATESRAHPRYRVWFPVQLSSDGTGGGPGFEATLGVTRDASQGGILVSSTAPLAVGTEITVTFSVPPDDTATRTIRGRITRLTPNEDDPHGPFPFRVAVKFDEPVDDLEPLFNAASQKLEAARRV